MHLEFIVFFMVIAPVYLNEAQKLQGDNKILNNPLCPNNKILIDTLRHLKENVIDDINSKLSPEKLKQILNTTVQYLNEVYGSGDNVANNTHFQGIDDNANHREKKQVFRNNPNEASPDKLKGSIQYELPTIHHPECEHLFKAIVNAINVAYMQLNNFCLESGKCYVQKHNILDTQNVASPMPAPTLTFPPEKKLLYSNQLINQSNILDFSGSYPQSGDFLNLLQNYRPNTGNALNKNYWSIHTSSSPKNSVQGNFFNQVQGAKLINANQNPDPLTILQSYRPKYTGLIKNHATLTSPGNIQINTLPYFQDYASMWTFLQHNKPNASVKEFLPNSEHTITTVNNGDGNGGWNKLTGDQGLIEFQTVLNHPTGYVSVPPVQGVIPQFSFHGQNHTFLEHNFTPNTYLTPQLNIQPMYNNEDKKEVIKNNSDTSSNIPWNNNLRLNTNVPNLPDNDINGNVPAFLSNLNVPYIQPNMNGVPNYQGNGFSIKPQMNIPSYVNYPNAHLPQVNQNGEKYFNPDYFNQMKQYYQTPPYSPNLKLPSSKMLIQRQVTNPQVLNWYNQKGLQNPFQNGDMINIPNNGLDVNQLPYYSQTEAPISDNTFANHLNIPKELSDLYRLTMTNKAKLNITPNKNGIVELTFTLQPPQSYVYKPLYYVKYRLPYQTYMYNVHNILKNRPYLRNNPTELYQELLEVANMSESSQDLKHLPKEEISKLVVTNGSLVKAKIIDEMDKSNVEDDIKSVLRLTSDLNPKALLSSTKKALHQVELMNTSMTTRPRDDDETSKLPVKVLNTRSVGYSIYPQFTSHYAPPININGGHYAGVQPYTTENKVPLDWN